MNDQTVTGTTCIRIATDDDIPCLAIHHRMMFEEILEKNGVQPDLSDMAVLEEEYAKKLVHEFRSGTCISWVVQTGDRIVSSGAISIVSYVPVPHDLSPRIAFLHSVYTEKGFRHQHLAYRITEEAMNFCRYQGIKRLYLVASDAGRPLYEKSGFVDIPNMMMLIQ